MSTIRPLGRLFRVSTALACAAAVLAAGPSPAAAAPDTTPPPTPINFLVNGVTDTVVSMQWAPGYLTEPTGWRVYRNGVQVRAGGGSAYTDRGLTPGATYSYHIVAYDAAGNTAPPTRTITVTTRGPGVQPDPPANLRVIAVAPARVTLEFDRPGDEFDVSRYRVYDGGTQVATGDRYPFAGATTTVEIRNLVPGSAHAYTVRAERSGYGLSAPTNTAAVTLPGTTDTRPPSAPGGLVATESGYACDFADLTWTQSADDADAAAVIDYEVYTDGAFNHVVRGVVQSPAVQFLSHGTHTITVRAVDSSGNASPHSNTATFHIGPFCPLGG
jgi:predicted phage tail protein